MNYRKIRLQKRVMRDWAIITAVCVVAFSVIFVAHGIFTMNVWEAMNNIPDIVPDGK